MELLGDKDITKIVAVLCQNPLRDLVVARELGRWQTVGEGTALGHVTQCSSIIRAAVRLEGDDP